MRRWTFWIVMIALTLGFASVAPAGDDDKEGTEIDWFGALRIRPEHNDNMSDALAGREDKIGYVAYRANLGARVMLPKDVTVVLDGQFIGAWGDEMTQFRGSQTMNSGVSGSGEFRLFNAYVKAEKILGTGFGVTVGRQPLVFGDEWLMGDEDFYGGTSWDGARGYWETDTAHTSVFWAKGSENDNPEFFAGGVSTAGDLTGDFDLYGLWSSINLSSANTLDVALLYGHDAQNNSINPNFNLTDKRFTLTFLYRYGAETGFFANVDLAAQDGTTAINIASAPAEVDVEDSYAGEATVGWQWNKDGHPYKTWIRLAHYDGDDVSTPEIETFRPIAQDTHGRQGLVDFWNGMHGYPAFIGGEYGFQMLQLGFEASLPHGISLSGRAQLNQAAQQISSTNDIRRLGEEFGITAGYHYSDNVDLELGVAQVFPGTAFTFIAPGFGQDTVRRVYLNTTVSF